MATASACLAVGGPHLFTGDGWDAAPLVLTIAILAFAAAARLPLRPLTVLGAVLGALLVDLLTDVWKVSLLTAIAAIGLTVSMLALRRIPRR